MKRFAFFGRCVGTLGVVSVLLALAGCSPRTGTVSGTITYQGKPLGNGRIMFINQNDSTKVGTGLIQPDGSYTAANVPLGPAAVTVETTPTPQSSGTGPGARAGPKSLPAGMEMPKVEGGGGKYVKIPDKYRAKELSGLTYDVQPGQQKKDFDLP